MGKFQFTRSRYGCEKEIAWFRSAPYKKPIVVFAAVRSNPWVVNLVEECCMTS